MTGASPRLITTTDLAREQIQAVQALVRDATRADGVPPLREHVLLQVRAGGSGRSTLAYDGDDSRLLGFAHLDVGHAGEGPAIELAVHPQARNQGIGTALLDDVLSVCPPPPSPVRLWAHGENAAAAQLARARGFLRVRHLFQMRRSLFSALPPVTLPHGIAIRTLDADRDVPALQRLNAASFTDLPDQGSWTQSDIRMRMAEHWFDPADVLLAVSGPELLGFHWTKPATDRTPSPPERPEPADTVGEVYVVGVHPQARGRGLGRQLTLAGLHHLRDRGHGSALLYVDATNAPAMGLYRSLGFAVWDSDMLFRR